jgi:hypothetical protein
VGTWSFGKHDDYPVTGGFLTFFWIMEVIMLIASPPIFMSMIHRFEPYCEVSNQEAEKKEIPHLYEYILNPDSFRNSLEQKNESVITEMKRVEEDSSSYSKFTLYLLPASNKYYLTVKNESQTLESDDKTSKTETDIVEFIEISSHLAKELARNEGYK